MRARGFASGELRNLRTTEKGCCSLYSKGGGLQCQVAAVHDETDSNEAFRHQQRPGDAWSPHLRASGASMLQMFAAAHLPGVLEFIQSMPLHCAACVRNSPACVCATLICRVD